MNLSVIIRTYNEADWLAFALDSVLKQKGIDLIKIYIVDSGSTDSTLKIANSYKDISNLEILNYEGKYLPGRSLNQGILKALHSESDYVLIFSAHCIIQEDTAALEMINIINNNDKVRSVSGRQLPLEFSDAIAFRDMTHLYHSESRLIEKHPMLNNAFSLFSIDAFKDHLFDNNATNLEDVLWAHEEIKLGFNLFYSSDQSVSHYHGPNHSNDIKRLDTSINVIKTNPDVFGTKMSKLGITEKDLLKIAFIQTFNDYKNIFNVISEKDVFIYCSDDVKKQILAVSNNSSLFIKRDSNNKDNSLYNEYFVLQDTLISKFPKKKYIISYDGSVNKNFGVVSTDSFIDEIERSFSDVIWPVIIDNSRRITNLSQSKDFNQINNFKEVSYRVLRGNGSAIKISKMNDLSQISYSSIIISKS